MQNAYRIHTFIYMLTRRSAVSELLADVADGSEKINSARDCFNRAERMTSTSTALQSDNDSTFETERERKHCVLFSLSCLTCLSKEDGIDEDEE